jgi:TonB family protein
VGHGERHAGTQQSRFEQQYFSALMSTLESTALWSATPISSEEAKVNSTVLSVRQRKLLALLAQPASVQQLAAQIALPEPEVQLTLERFAKLGLAKSDASEPFNPMLTRATPAPQAPASSRMPLFAGLAVTAIALLGSGAWLMRGGSGTGSTAASATSTATKASAAEPASAAAPANRVDESADAGQPKAAGARAPANAAAAAAATAKNAPAATPPALATAAPATKAAAASPTAATDAPAKATPPVLSPAAVAAPAAPATPAVTTIAPIAAVTPPPAATAPTPTPAPVAAVTAPVIAPVAAAPAPAVAAPAVAATAAVPPATTPAARPATPSREIKLVNRVEPPFPRGIDADRGNVRARLQVDARGVVTSVEIVEAVPPRVFDRAVRSALQQWRYEPTGEAFSAAAEISFAR